MISSLARSSYQLLRLTPFLLDPVVASSGGHAATRQPVTASSVQVKATAAGTVTLVGTVGGSTGVTEVLTFGAAGYRATARMFTAISSITPAGALLGTTIEAKALGADGSPQTKALSPITSGWPGAFSPGAPTWARSKEVQRESRDSMIAFDYREDLEPRRGDMLLDETTGERWLIDGVNLFGGARPHHWEAHVKLWDGEARG